MNPISNLAYAPDCRLIGLYIFNPPPSPRMVVILPSKRSFSTWNRETLVAQRRLKRDFTFILKTLNAA